MSSAANTPRGGPRKQEECRGENNFPRGRRKGGLEVHPDFSHDPFACTPLAGSGRSSLTYTTFSFALLLSYPVLQTLTDVLAISHSPRLSQDLSLEASWPCHEAPAATLMLDEKATPPCKDKSPISCIFLWQCSKILAVFPSLPTGNLNILVSFFVSF